MSFMMLSSRPWPADSNSSKRLDAMCPRGAAGDGSILSIIPHDPGATQCVSS